MNILRMGIGMTAWILPTLVLCGVPGCAALLEGVFPENVPASLLDGELGASAVPKEAHPLKDIEPGTALDDLSGLDGCWVTVRTSQGIDAAGGVITEQATQLCRFDASEKRFLMYDFDEFTPSAPQGSGMRYRRYLFMFTGTYAVLDANALRLSFSNDSRGAALTAAGLLAFDAAAAVVAAISDGATEDWLVTIQGDYLVTQGYSRAAAAAGPDYDPLADLSGAQYWTRIDRPE